MTQFDLLPYSFSPETIDMVTAKYIEMQRTNQLVEVNYPTRYRISRLDAILTHMADFPDDIKPDEVVYMATLLLSWVESLFHNEEING